MTGMRILLRRFSGWSLEHYPKSKHHGNHYKKMLSRISRHAENHRVRKQVDRELVDMSMERNENG